MCTAVLEQARGTVAGFLGARPDDVVVFTRNTTDALNLLAGVRAGPGAHPRRRAPRQPAAVARGGHRVLPAAAHPGRDARPACAAALAAEPTALVAVTGASNVTGEVLPLAEIAALAHAAGARLLVDAAQLAPHRRIDIAGTGIDYLALSGHKLYAPFGAGVLVGRRDWLDAGDAVPGRRWGHPPGPYRRRGGRRGDRHRRGGTGRGGAGPPRPSGTRAAPRTWSARPRWPPPAGPWTRCSTRPRPTHERALLDRLVDRLDEIPGLTRLRIWPDCPDRVGVVSFTVDPYPAGLVAAYLSAEHGIGVRDGRFCAHPLVERLTTEAEGAVRASLGIGTTADDVDRLADALGRAGRARPGLDLRRASTAAGPPPRIPARPTRWASPAEDAESQPIPARRRIGAKRRSMAGSHTS